MQQKLLKETASIARRIASLKKIAKTYYPLAEKALIDKHTELLRIFDVRGSKHKEKHPHRQKRVYITRRVLKHVVERRKAELIKKHSPGDAMDSICFLLEKIPEVVINFDLYSFEPPTHIYLRSYVSTGEPFVRVMVEEIDDRLEIISVHYSKNKRLS